MNLDDVDRYTWIHSVLSYFERNVFKPIEDNQPALLCQVLNIKMFDEPISGVGALVEVHDRKLFMKALFSAEAIKRFDEREALTSCAEFTKLTRSLLDLTRYHIEVVLPPQIEKSDIAIYVEDFKMVAYSVPLEYRRLQPALRHPDVLHDLRRMWRAKFTPEEPDTSQESQESVMSPFSCLLEVMRVSSQASELSDPELDKVRDEDQNSTSASQEVNQKIPPSRAVFELGPEGYNEPGQSPGEALRKAFQEAQTKLIVAKNYPELANNKIPKSLRDARGFTVQVLPLNLEEQRGTFTINLDFAGCDMDPAEWEIPEAQIKKLDAIEEWKPGYIPPSSLPVESSSANDVFSFVTDPSMEEQAQKEPGEIQEQLPQREVAQRGSKRKLSYEAIESPCKVARNSDSKTMNGAEDLNLELSSERLISMATPNQEAAAVEASEGDATAEQVGASSNSSFNLESSGLTALCECLTPLDEQLDGDENQTSPIQSLKGFNKPKQRPEETLRKAVHKVQTKNFPEVANDKIPESLRDAWGCTMQVLPQNLEEAAAVEASEGNATAEQIGASRNSSFNLESSGLTALCECLTPLDEQLDGDVNQTNTTESPKGYNEPEQSPAEALRKAVDEVQTKLIVAENFPEQVGANRNSSSNLESSGLSALCECLTPLDEQSGADWNQTNPTEGSPESDWDSCDTSLVVSCEEPSQNASDHNRQAMEDSVNILDARLETVSPLKVDQPNSSYEVQASGDSERCTSPADVPGTEALRAKTIKSPVMICNVEETNVTDIVEEMAIVGQLSNTSAELFADDAEISSAGQLSRAPGQGDTKTSKQLSENPCTSSRITSEQSTDGTAEARQVRDKDQNQQAEEDSVIILDDSLETESPPKQDQPKSSNEVQASGDSDRCTSPTDIPRTKALQVSTPKSSVMASNAEETNVIDIVEEMVIDDQESNTGAELFFKEAGISNEEQVSNASGHRNTKSQPLTKQSLENACTSAEIAAERIADGTAVGKQVRDKAPLVSIASHSCLPSTSRTVKVNFASVKPVKRTASLTNSQMRTTESKDETRGHQKITRLRSPTILGSLSAPVHSLTSHQPPKKCQSQTPSSICSEEETFDPASSATPNPSCGRQLDKHKVEEHVLEWCVSYFQRRNRKH